MKKSGTDTDFPKSVSVPDFSLHFDVEPDRESVRRGLAAHVRTILNIFKNAGDFLPLRRLIAPQWRASVAR